jgi:hypothetical protein
LADSLEEVRRASDDELEGFVMPTENGFDALTVFHGVIASTATRDEARTIVHVRGLASLAERWYWRSRVTDAWSVVVPQEARPGFVRVAVGYYALPGVPTAVITAEDVAQGDALTLEPPDETIDGLPR